MKTSSRKELRKAATSLQKIFVIETYDDLRDVYEEVLSSQGYEVNAFSCWQAAHEKLQGGATPHIMMFDPYQGGADELLGTFGQAGGRSGVSVFAISSLKAQQLSERHAYDAILQKPIDLDELLKLLD